MTNANCAQTPRRLHSSLGCEFRGWMLEVRG